MVAEEEESTVTEESPSGGSVKFAIIIVFLGIFHFVLKRYLGADNELIFIFSLVLFALGGVALYNKFKDDRKSSFAVSIPMLFFVIWYFIFGGNYEPSFLLVFVPLFLCLIFLLLFLTHGKSAMPELFGFLPALFLFLDLGFLHFLVTDLRLPITPLVENLIVWTPWWAYFGLYALSGKVSSNKRANSLITILQVLGVVYAVITLVIPAVPDLGFDESLLPGPDKLQEARARFEESVPQTPPFFLTLECIWEGEYADLKGCSDLKRKKAQWHYICETVENHIPDSKSNQDCLKEQRERDVKGIVQTSGIDDPTFDKPSRIEFVAYDYPQTVSYGDRAIKLPIILDIENPRKQEFGVEFSCEFVKGKEEPIEGEIFGEKSIRVLTETVSKNVICQPPDGLEGGKYKLKFIAEVIGFKTASHIGRVFIGEKDDQWKEEWIPKIVQLYFPRGHYASKSTPDPVRFNFALGMSEQSLSREVRALFKDTPPQEIPIIQSGGELILEANVENKGNGEITRIAHYRLGLEDFSVAAECKEGFNVPLPDTSKRKITLVDFCTIDSLPLDLMAPEEFVYKEFVAELEVDYKLEKEVSVTFLG